MKDVQDNKLSKKFIANIILSMIIAACLIGIDQVNRLYHAHGLYWNIHLGLLLMTFTLSFLLDNRHFLIFCSVIFGLLFFQLIYFGYFGAPLEPMDISLFFTHMNESVQDFTATLNIIYFPIILCSLAFLLIFITNKKLNVRQRWKYAWIILLIELFIPTINIIKMAYYDHGVRRDVNKSVGDYPSMGDNLWESMQKTMLYYFFYTLPHQLFLKNHLHQGILLPPISRANHQKNLNIVLIMGESLTSRHMSAFKYPRPTTPFFDSLKHHSNVIFKSGISAGVCTDISLAMFFNTVFRPDASEQIASTQWNLFKMAKNNGFETYFISAQRNQALAVIRPYLLPSFIDHYADSKMFGESSYTEGILDEKLREYAEGVDFQRPVFMVLHQIGSHFPYDARYPKDLAYFNSPDTSEKQEQIDSYDNTVRYTDSIVASISKLITQKTHRPTILIFTSDHGESLGENGVYGHNHLEMEDQFHVPIVFIALNGAKLDFLKRKKKEDINSKVMSHYELAKIVAYLLGYRIDRFSTQKDHGYVVNGNALTGIAGYNAITFDIHGNLINHFQ